MKPQHVEKDLYRYIRERVEVGKKVNRRAVDATHEAQAAFRRRCKEAGRLAMERLQLKEDFSRRTPGYGGVVSYQEEAYENGWYLGPVSAQDNHSGDYGVADYNRTGVLATELTRDVILEPGGPVSFP